MVCYIEVGKTQGRMYTGPSVQNAELNLEAKNIFAVCADEQLPLNINGGHDLLRILVY